jgi:predicted permease
MLKIFEVTFPFFALVLVGWAVARRGWLPLESIPALNLFVLYFALPCMLFRFAAATPIARIFDPTVFGTWLGCAVALVGLAMVLTRRGRIGWNNAAFGALVAAFSNSGFMGVPLLVDLLGERAVAPGRCR